jgi:RNA polymerase sigma factor for flagellar operon FliA
MQVDSRSAREDAEASNATGAASASGIREPMNNVSASAPCKRSADLMAHRPLVKQIARRILHRLPPNVGMNEMEQAGLLGLQQALSRFEEGHGSSFKSYAARRIEGSMLDALREADTVPRVVRSRVRKVRVAVQRLEHRLGRPPRAKEVANELGWSLEEFHRTMADSGAGSMRTGDENLENLEDDSEIWGHDGDEHSVIDEHADPLQLLQNRQRHAALNAAFDALEKAERYVMRSIYKDDLTVRNIGLNLGISESRVSRMASDIVAKLRIRLREQ